MIIAGNIFTGLELGFRHVEGEVLDMIFDYEDRFSWGLHLSILFFDLTVGFDKRGYVLEE